MEKDEGPGTKGCCHCPSTAHVTCQQAAGGHSLNSEQLGLLSQVIRLASHPKPDSPGAGSWKTDGPTEEQPSLPPTSSKLPRRPAPSPPPCLRPSLLSLQDNREHIKGGRWGSLHPSPSR